MSEGSAISYLNVGLLAIKHHVTSEASLFLELSGVNHQPHLHRKETLGHFTKQIIWCAKRKKENIHFLEQHEGEQMVIKLSFLAELTL